MKHFAILLLLFLLGFDARADNLRFTPPSGDDTLREFANGLGKTPEERQQLFEAVSTAKLELFEQPYAAKGWKNNVAGAYAYFVISMDVIRSGKSPDEASKNRLFARLGEALAADLAGVSDREKSELYNTLIANASLPMLFYIDARQNNNPAQVEHARTMAADYGRRILKMEPAEVSALLQPAGGGQPEVARAAAGQSVGPQAASGPAVAGGANVDGRYECMHTQLLHAAGANFTTQYQPTGMWFAIRGNSYSSHAAGGTVQANDEVVSFRGGAYDGWRGARRGDAIVFRKDHSDPQPGVPVRVGDLRCGRRTR